MLFVLVTLIECSGDRKSINDFIKIDDITKVVINNNNGFFNLSST